MDLSDFESMESIRRILQHESDSGNLRNHVPTALTNVSSRYELLKNIFSVNATLGNVIIDIHNFKHPTAVEKQRVLFNQTPGLFPFLMTLLLDSNQPIRQLNQYITLISLLDDKYPTLLASDEYISDWSIKFEDALNDFLEVCTLCALFAANTRDKFASERRLLRTIAQARISPFKSGRASKWSRNSGPAGRPPKRSFTPLSEPEGNNFLETWLPMYRLKPDVEKSSEVVEGIRILGSYKPDDKKLILELARTHKYLLARKLALIRSIEPSPKFTVGLINMITIVKDFPSMIIGYTYDGAQNENIPTLGLDFNKLHPIVCMHEQAGIEVFEQYQTNDFDYYFIKLDTVTVGDLPTGLENSKLGAMKEEWISRAKEFGHSLPALFNPFLHQNRTEKPVFKKRKGVDLCNHYFWEDRYLMHIIAKYRAKNFVDTKIVDGKANRYTTKRMRETIGDWHLGMPPEKKFKAAPVLYMPFTYLTSPS